jgi:hypothetical protein
MVWMHQEPVNQELEPAPGLTTVMTEAVEDPQYCKDFQLKVTLTIVPVQDDRVRKRFEGGCPPEIHLVETGKNTYNR